MHWNAFHGRDLNNRLNNWGDGPLKKAARWPRGYHLGEAVLQIEVERKCEFQHAAEAEGAPEWVP